MNIPHLKKLAEEMITKNPNGAMYISPQIFKELITDTDRLEWMIKNAGWYRHTDHDEEHTYIQIKMLKGADLSCKPMVISAIDAAMKESNESGA